jgi:hypothetical protein
LAGVKTSALRALGEVHSAIADDGAKLPQRLGPSNAGIEGLTECLELGLRSAVVMMAAVLSWALGRCL